jgi:hypothetical protein
VLVGVIEEGRDLVSFRASSVRATIDPPDASISLTSGSSLAPSRRPAKTVNPSAANFFAISAPI